MSTFDEFTRRNREWAAAGGAGVRSPMPRHRLFVIACLDPRVDPAAFLQVEAGDAIVARNAGGRVTDAVIDDIALITAIAERMGARGQRLEVAVIHHTDCGTALLAEPDFRTRFAARVHTAPAELAAQAVTDPRATVAADVERVQDSPLLEHRVVVSGHVFDLASGLVTTVVPAADAGPPRLDRVGA
jgi:carbonic anhydrase